VVADRLLAEADVTRAVGRIVDKQIPAHDDGDGGEA
jgi:hypothetical protein